MSCHHTITFCTTSICQPNNLCIVVLKLFANIIPSVLCNLHQVVLFIFFPSISFCVLCCFAIPAFLQCSFLFCEHLCAIQFFSSIHSYELCWLIITLFSPCSFSSSFRLLTNRVSFSLKFYIDFATCLWLYVKGNFEQNNGKLSREWTHKRAIIAHVLVFLCRILKLKFCFQDDLNI